MTPQAPRRIILAYSGGLDTSVMLKWLTEKYDCEVIAYTADVGQGLGELSGLEAKARATGASSFHAIDLTEPFISDYVNYAIKAGAIYEGAYLLGTALARPIIAAGQVELAQRLGADAVAHGATGKGNDQVRFELTYAALGPELQIIAPWRTWEFKSRSDLIAYAKNRDIPITATAEKPYSVDANLMHTSYEGGILENPWAAPPAGMFQLTSDLENTPDKATELTVDFERGVAVAINGKALAPAALLTQLNLIAGTHGIGRLDLVENRFVGMKSRGVYETPGATVLHTALRALESICLDREVLALRQLLSPQVAKLIYNGFWFAPEFKILEATMTDIAKDLSGTIRLRLFKGQCTILGRRSPLSLYAPALATFEEDSVYQQSDAEGFIRLNALRLKTFHQRQAPSLGAPAPDPKEDSHVLSH